MLSIKTKRLIPIIVIGIILTLVTSTSIFARESFFLQSENDVPQSALDGPLKHADEKSQESGIEGYTETMTEVGQVAKKVNNKSSINQDATNAALDEFWETIRTLISFITGFGALSSFVIFMVIFMRLSALPSHPTQRRKTMEDIVTSGVATILLGGLTLILTVFYSFFEGFLSSGLLFASDWRVAFTILMIRYKYLISAMLGVGSLTMLLMFIRSFMQLTTSGGNPQARSQALTGLFITGIATAGMGGIAVVVALFQGVLQ